MDLNELFGYYKNEDFCYSNDLLCNSCDALVDTNCETKLPCDPSIDPRCMPASAALAIIESCDE